MAHGHTYIYIYLFLRTRATYFGPAILQYIDVGLGNGGNTLTTASKLATMQSRLKLRGDMENEDQLPEGHLMTQPAVSRTSLHRFALEQLHAGRCGLCGM